MSQIKVLIVEDEPVIAENMSLYLNNNDFEVSGISYDAEDALEQLRINTPDVVLLDVNLESEKDGIDLALHINEKYQLPFLFVTSYSDRKTIERAKPVKPGGYIVKPFNEKTLLASLQIAISNHAAEKNHHVTLLLDKLNKHLPKHLTDREFDILQLVFEGNTNTQIAEKLFITANTIKTHLKSIHIKLDANSRLAVINRLRELMQR
jgi:DNA-binding NarL/FixJ family response regulator